jgi:hypothetical protein
MHTRQLDMVMSDPSAVAHYRAKIRADLETLHGGEPSVTCDSDQGKGQ